MTKDIKWRQDQLLALARMIKERETEFYDVIKQDLGRGPFDSYAEVRDVAPHQGPAYQ